jgi:hypothetical protein
MEIYHPWPTQKQQYYVLNGVRVLILLRPGLVRYLMTMLLFQFLDSGADYNPFYNPCMSVWSVDCFKGELEKIKEHVRSDAKIVEMRETVMNVSGVFHVIAGACTLENRTDKSPIPNEVVVNVVDTTDHLGCARYLVQEANCKVDAKDFAGFTPLHHCVGCFANNLTRKIATVLLEAGADPNCPNRLGETPLFEATRSGNIINVEFLLDHGARVDLCNNSGITLMSVATGKPEIIQVFSGKIVKPNLLAASIQKELRVTCAVCESSSNCKRCTGCYQLWYCSPDCQKSHWNVHKDACKCTKNEFKAVAFETNVDGVEGSTTLPIVEFTLHLIVKIQVPLDLAVELNQREISFSDCLEKKMQDPTIFLLVYTKDKSVFGCIRQGCKHFSAIVKIIHEQGLSGFRGYFSATFDKDGILKINFSRLLSPQPW